MTRKKTPTAWGRVSDTLTWHRKTLIAGNEAMGLWVRCLSHCIAQLNDGEVQREIVPACGASFDVAQRLVDAGLWSVTDTGYQFNDWEEWQSTREEIEGKRQANAQRVARHRAKGTPAEEAAAAVERTELGAQHEPQLLMIDDEPPAPVDIADKRSPYSKQFEAWYQHYPRKVGKGAASKAFERLRKSRTMPDDLVEITQRYAQLAKTMDPQFVPHPSTWLNERRFDDETLNAPAVAAPVSSRLLEWLEARGVTLDEYNSRKGDGAWLEALKQKGSA